MSLSKEEFKNAFREVIKEEFSDIPDSEEKITHEFSGHFNDEMDTAFSRSKKSAVKFMNSASKKIALVVLAAVFCSTSVYAVATTVIKIKNKYQLAAEQGIPLEEVDTEDNFAYTEFDDAEKEVIKDESTDNLITERFEDPKTDIYNKMLNSIDFFNEAEITVETSMLGNIVSTIKYQTNIDEGFSYQAVIKNGVVINETYCDKKDEYLMYVDNHDKTYGYDLPIYNRDDTPYIPLRERIVINETDNLPCYT